MILVLVLVGFAVLVYGGLTAWDGNHLRLSSVLLSLGGWACIISASLLVAEHA